MTAEIVIMNKAAVALAADSAVTVSGPNSSKIYNSANKLFVLTKGDPVGVMIYGSAQYMGMPWETVIKDFRESPEAVTRDHLEEYAQAFIRFISSADHLWDTSVATDWAIKIVHGYFDNVVRKNIMDAASIWIRDKGSITEIQTKLLASRIIKLELDSVENTPLLYGVDRSDVDSLARRYSKKLSGVASQVFQQIPLSERSKTALRRLGASLLLRQGPWRDDSITGVVIAGFGRCDYYPRSFHFMPRACINGTLYHTTPEISSVNNKQQAVVQAFAQHEMVRTFLEGIDPRFRQAVSSWVKKILQGLASIAPQLTSVSSSLLADFENTLSDLSAREFRNDVIGTVAILPKDELAAMAESLVNLTSFKRRVTMSPESVGGPIDVAVVSKGDGFVWIRRKHYFEPELNPHFFARYQ